MMLALLCFLLLLLPDHNTFQGQQNTTLFCGRELSWGWGAGACVRNQVLRWHRSHVGHTPHGQQVFQGTVLDIGIE
ncbi:11271_t:CDS:2 [Gigaspora rosea]|nr:11271_t:CDS:2 [Gigaspora rosea]